MVSSPPGSGIPDVPEAKAPWKLTGDAYILLYLADDDFIKKNSFTPATLQGRYEGSFSIIIIVDYKTSNVGPYREIMFIPGKYRFKDRSCYSITKIYVSTWDSVVNGRENWGIPKDRADMKFTTDEDGTEHFMAFKNSRMFAYVKLKPFSIFPVPVHSGILPAFMRTVAQHYKGKTYFYRPVMQGWAKSALLLESFFHQEHFPDIDEGSLFMAFKLADMEMDFPVSEIVKGLD